MKKRFVKIFKNGSHQAIRLPKEYAFDGVTDVVIRRDGKSLVITPVRPSWLSFADMSPADVDFMISRPNLVDVPM